VGTLDGKVAVVTGGGGRNIGLGICLALASAGADIAVLDALVENAEATAELVRERGRRAIAVHCDVMDAPACSAAVARTVDELGGIDILVNSARRGGRPFTSFLETTEDDMRVSWESGPVATFRLMQLCQPHLAARQGCVVNIGSGASTAGTIGFTAYASAKEALRGLTKVAAAEWGTDGVRVNIVLPVAQEGGVPSPFLAGRPQAPRALERMGHPEHDIGAAVVYLAGPGSYITGRTLMVDGGSGFYR
jgi:NAD(P)-dependent dehydrogenase (short-subunit alcohol dehydrogenase family)